MKLRLLFTAMAVAACGPATAADVVFAGGKAQVPLPDGFTASQQGDSVLATFGAGGSHRLEISLTGILDTSESSTVGIAFVSEQASKKGAKLNRGRDRAVFIDPAGDRQIDGKPFRIVHWQIGVRGCVLTMTVTAPLPMSSELQSFLSSDLNTIVNGVGCRAVQ